MADSRDMVVREEPNNVMVLLASEILATEKSWDMTRFAQATLAPGGNSPDVSNPYMCLRCTSENRIRKHLSSSLLAFLLALSLLCRPREDYISELREARDDR